MVEEEVFDDGVVGPEGVHVTYVHVTYACVCACACACALEIGWAEGECGGMGWGGPW